MEQILIAQDYNLSKLEYEILMSAEKQKRKLQNFIIAKRTFGIINLHVGLKKGETGSFLKGRNHSGMAIVRVNGDTNSYLRFKSKYGKTTNVKISNHAVQRVRERYNNNNKSSIETILELLISCYSFTYLPTTTRKFNTLLCCDRGVFIIKDSTLITYINVELLSKEQYNFIKDFINMKRGESEIDKYFKLNY